MASRGGFRSRPINKTIFVKIGDGPETSPPDLVYSIKNALLKFQSFGMNRISRVKEERVDVLGIFQNRSWGA